ncbi:MAG: ABC transporter ATP-binding protein [Treponema sp.]|nr:ABC transporter ATP-binding protein [Candidatus Treponema merdequi]
MKIVNLHAEYIEKANTASNSSNASSESAIHNSTNVNIKIAVQNSTVKIFENFSFEVADGSTVAILGASGTGKSTMLSCISGLGAENLSYSFEESSFPQFCSVDFQKSLLLPHLSILENTALPLYDMYGKKTALEAAEKYLEKTGLSQKAKSLPSECSGGECGRAALARAFAFLENCCPDDEVPLLLLDEPFKSQDVKTKEVLLKYFLELKNSSKNQITTLFVTHSAEEAEKVSDRIITLEGRPAFIKDDRKN